MEYLNSLREERVFIVSKARSTGFDDVLKVDGNTIRMTIPPEDLIIVSV
jgi:hypothetical protein